LESPTHFIEFEYLKESTEMIKRGDGASSFWRIKGKAQRAVMDGLKDTEVARQKQRAECTKSAKRKCNNIRTHRFSLFFVSVQLQITIKASVNLFYHKYVSPAGKNMCSCNSLYA